MQTIKGVMAVGTKIHAGVFVRMTKDHNNQDHPLHRPACQRVSFKNHAYLLPINGDKPVTCAKCLAWLEKQAGKQA